MKDAQIVKPRKDEVVDNIPSERCAKGEDQSHSVGPDRGHHLEIEAELVQLWLEDWETL